MMINKTFKQLNAERAARRDEYEECQDLNNPGWREIHKYNKKKQKKNKASSSQAGGPAHKAPSGKINYFKKKFDRDLKIG